MEIMDPFVFQAMTGSPQCREIRELFHAFAGCEDILPSLGRPFSSRLGILQSDETTWKATPGYSRNLPERAMTIARKMSLSTSLTTWHNVLTQEGGVSDLDRAGHERHNPGTSLARHEGTNFKPKMSEINKHILWYLWKTATDSKGLTANHNILPLVDLNQYLVKYSTEGCIGQNEAFGEIIVSLPS